MENIANEIPFFPLGHISLFVGSGGGAWYEGATISKDLTLFLQSYGGHLGPLWLLANCMFLLLDLFLQDVFLHAMSGCARPGATTNWGLLCQQSILHKI